MYTVLKPVILKYFKLFLEQLCENMSIKICQLGVLFMF